LLSSEDIVLTLSREKPFPVAGLGYEPVYSSPPLFKKVSLSTIFLGEGTSEHRLVVPKEKEMNDCINLLSFLSEQPHIS